ncbi:hypothetical protein ABPG75_003839 [Micractinium tetrahymenae]
MRVKVSALITLVVARSLVPALCGPLKSLPVPTLPHATAQVTVAAGTPQLGAALRSCLAAIGCRLVDGSNPAALRAASSDRLWAKLHSTQVPLAVVFPRSADQVAKAVKCARNAGVKVTASMLQIWRRQLLGYSVRAGTITIDLTELDRAAVAANKATVVVEAGALLGRAYYEVWRQAGEGYGLVAGTCPNVGVAGHILAGGFSYLSPQFGLSCDSLLSLEMVTADGQVVTAARSQNPDLFAASCGGGGGNFGIATRFLLKLHRVARTYTQASVEIDAEHGLDFLMHWQSKILAAASPSLFCEINLRSRGRVSVHFAMAGNSLALKSELRQLGVLNSPWLPGSSLPQGSVQELSWIKLMVEAAGSKAPNHTVEALLDSAYALSQRDYFTEKSWFVSKALPRQAFADIVTAIEAAGAVVTLNSIALRSAVHRQASNATAFPWRNAIYRLKAARHTEKEGEIPLLDKAVQKVQKVVAPLLPGQPAYLGYVDGEASADPLLSYYGSNLGWLQRVKSRWDPSGFFSTTPLAIPLASSTRN